jgi:hypothetical protein
VVAKEWYRCTGLQYCYHQDRKQVKEWIDEITEKTKRDYCQSRSQEKEEKAG